MLQQFRRGLALVGVLAIAGGVFLARELNAQVPTIKGRGRHIQDVEIIQNSVGNLTTTPVFTVPAGATLVITDVVVANTNAGSSCCARLFRDGDPATAFIAVPPGGSFSHTYTTGIKFGPGQVVSVRNGDSIGGIHFDLRGYLAR